MARMSDGAKKIIANNKKAFHNFMIHERLEAGLVLVGTEVKSLRDGKVQLAESYARFKGGELWLFQAHISEYRHGNLFNHDPVRPRKILLHKREMLKLKKSLEQKGRTLVPLSMYFKRGKAKVELGVATGKNTHDKRQALKSKEADREMRRAMRHE